MSKISAPRSNREFVEACIKSGDAVEDVKQHAAYVTKARGGYGAVREVAEMILKAQDKWDKILSKIS